MVSNETNILIGRIPLRDQELMLGPYKVGDAVIRYKYQITYPELLKDLGFFKSTSQARKAGWGDKEIPQGFTDLRIGKKKRRLTILKAMR